MSPRRGRLRLVPMSVAGRGRPAPDDEQGAVYTAFWRERARRELVLDSIKASLEEQPSKAAVRSCARNWVAAVLALAEDVAKNKTEHSA
ncbi:hypothetical protein ACFZC6_16575 [Streptomyces ossamyceticus]|uniref:hypothetical protein n=1 Tax=Streptomyces ossamyceticus TaxID=249581 RepID=UPI0036E7E3BE